MKARRRTLTETHKRQGSEIQFLEEGDKWRVFVESIERDRKPDFFMLGEGDCIINTADETILIIKGEMFAIPNSRIVRTECNENYTKSWLKQGGFEGLQDKGEREETIEELSQRLTFVMDKVILSHDTLSKRIEALEARLKEDEGEN